MRRGERGVGGGPARILHLDMDAFYAAIEVLDHPELAGKPLVVGAPPDQRGVVSTASYEARAYGIHSAMPSRTAGKRCPHAIFVPVRMGRYGRVSEQLMQLLHTYCPVVEQVSVDEAFMDVSGVLRRWGNALNLARAIKQAIRVRLQLTASVGVAPNKFLAKLASDLQKPDGLTVVPTEPDAIAAFLAPLEVTRIWGVGRKTAARLADHGITHVGDVQARTPLDLSSIVGEAAAAHIHALAFGVDERTVTPEHEAKSMSSEHTFAEDCADADVLRQVLIEMTEHVGRRLRRARVYASVGQIKYRYEDFSTFTRRRTMEPPTASDRTLLACAMHLLEQERLTQPIRLVGFEASGLVGHQESEAQPSLFPEFDPPGATERDQRLDNAVDKVRRVYGRRALRRGGGSD